MANLTVAEKTHWRDRIEARIDRRIEAITAGDPGLMDRVKHDARGASLGVARAGRVPGGTGPDRRPAGRAGPARAAVPSGDAGKGARSRARADRGGLLRSCTSPEVTRAIAKRQAVHEEELLAEHELGRRILQLRAEKERLLDTVWLASSPAQIRQLWTKVSTLLGEEPTELEREALAIPPAGEGV